MTRLLIVQLYSQYTKLNDYCTLITYMAVFLLCLPGSLPPQETAPPHSCSHQQEEDQQPLVRTEHVRTEAC